MIPLSDRGPPIGASIRSACISPPNIHMMENMSLTVASQSTSMLGPSYIKVMQFSIPGKLYNQTINFIGLGEIHVNEEFTGWQNEKGKMNYMYFLYSALSMAKTRGVCMDILVESNYHTAIQQNFRTIIASSLSDSSRMGDSMLWEVERFLVGCVPSEQDNTTECKLGCSNVRVHFTDARLQPSNDVLFTHIGLNTIPDKKSWIYWSIGGNVNPDMFFQYMYNLPTSDNIVLDIAELKYQYAFTIGKIRKREEKLTNMDVELLRKVVAEVTYVQLLETSRDGSFLFLLLVNAPQEYMNILRLLTPMDIGKRSYPCGPNLRGAHQPSSVLYFAGKAHVVAISLIFEILSMQYIPPTPQIQLRYKQLQAESVAYSKKGEVEVGNIFSTKRFASFYDVINSLFL